MNHTLIYELLEWLRLTHIAIVIKELVPEAAIDQVTCSVLCSSYIEIYIAPIFIGLTRYECFIVVRIHIAKIISRRTCKARHSAKFVGVTIGSAPILGTSQWRFSTLGRKKFIHLGKFERQLTFVDSVRLLVIIKINRERLAPIALTAENSVAQAVVNLHFTYSGFFYVKLCLCNGFLHIESIELQAFV